MQTTIDPAALRDAVPILLPRVLPTGLELLERNLVGRVTVHLVRAGERQDRVGLVAAERLQDVHGPDGVDVEVFERHASGEIVRWLSRAMNDQIETFLGEESQHGITISNVELDVLEPRDRRFEAALVPARVPVSAKENGAHVVVDTHDLRADFVEVDDRFGADETIRACDEDTHGAYVIARRRPAASAQSLPSRRSD